MDFFTGFQADRLISQIAEQSDPKSPAAQKAFAKLGTLGGNAVPKILEAIGSADKQQTAEYVEAFSKLTTDKNLMVVARGLADTDPRTVAGTAWALSSSKSYNINRLAELLSEDDYSKSAIIDVLTAHRKRLNIRQLLEQMENTMQSSASDGMCVMDGSLKRLMDSGTISGQEAYMQAFDKRKFEEYKDFA